MGRKAFIPLLLSLLIVFLSLSCTGNQSTQAPLFTITDIRGNKVSLADFKGQKAVMLLFFNYQIGTGQDPILQSYLAYYQGMDKLQIYPVINRGNLPNEMKQFMAGQARQSPGGLGFAVPLQDEDGSVSQAYDANPDKLTVILIDRNGNLRFRQEVTSFADANTDLAKQIENLTR